MLYKTLYQSVLQKNGLKCVLSESVISRDSITYCFGKTDNIHESELAAILEERLKNFQTDET